MKWSLTVKITEGLLRNYRALWQHKRMSINSVKDILYLGRRPPKCWGPRHQPIEPISQSGTACRSTRTYSNRTGQSLNDDKRVNPNSKNKSRTYRKFKSIFKLEPYLLFGTKQQRKLLTKFRISAHNLNIKKGRYIGTKVEDRICNLCKNNIEDEVHFL